MNEYMKPEEIARMERLAWGERHLRAQIKAIVAERRRIVDRCAKRAKPKSQAA